MGKISKFWQHANFKFAKKAELPKAFRQLTKLMAAFYLKLLE